MIRSGKRSKTPKIFYLFLFISVVVLRYVESATPCIEYGKVFLNLGLESEKRGQWNKSLDYYQKAIKFNPGLVEGYVQLAGINQKFQNFDLSVVNAQRAINLDPQSHQAHYALGLAYRAKGEHQFELKSIYRASELCRNYPCVAIYMFDLGISYNNVGDEIMARKCVYDLNFMKENILADRLEQAIAHK